MGSISFAEIDEHLQPWARAHSLPVYTEAKGEEIRSVLVIDSAQNQFHIWSIPDFEADYALVRVGAALTSRGNKKHTFHRERRNFVFNTSVPLTQVSTALEQAWLEVVSWQNELRGESNA